MWRHDHRWQVTPDYIFTGTRLQRDYFLFHWCHRRHQAPNSKSKPDTIKILSRAFHYRFQRGQKSHKCYKLLKNMLVAVSDTWWTYQIFLSYYFRCFCVRIFMCILTISEKVAHVTCIKYNRKRSCRETKLMGRIQPTNASKECSSFNILNHCKESME